MSVRAPHSDTTQPRALRSPEVAICLFLLLLVLAPSRPALRACGVVVRSDPPRAVGGTTLERVFAPCCCIACTSVLGFVL
ncbi:hypothetical protein C8Q77DRAFT_1082803 [Trametes polyzona]|nr:hypothetical protein C8Q77DRAFT_1082803 [Trametes polyzona]